MVEPNPESLLLAENESELKFRFFWKPNPLAELSCAFSKLFEATGVGGVSFFFLLLPEILIIMLEKNKYQTNILN